MAAAVGPSVRLHCGARAGVVPHNSLRAARCAQTDAASMSTKRASAQARRPRRCAALVAAQIAPAGCRPSRSRCWVCSPRPPPPLPRRRCRAGRDAPACEAPRR
jgi:hypothetical protein